MWISIPHWIRRVCFDAIFFEKKIVELTNKNQWVKSIQIANKSKWTFQALRVQDKKYYFSKHFNIWTIRWFGWKGRFCAPFNKIETQTIRINVFGTQSTETSDIFSYVLKQSPSWGVNFSKMFNLKHICPHLNSKWAEIFAQTNAIQPFSNIFQSVKIVRSICFINTNKAKLLYLIRMHCGKSDGKFGGVKRNVDLIVSSTHLIYLINRDKPSPIPMAHIIIQPYIRNECKLHWNGVSREPHIQIQKSNRKTHKKGHT